MHHLHLHDFNLWAVLAAALIQWFLGALWYSLFFAKPWMALTGHTPTPGERPKGAVFAMVSSFVGSFILSFILDHFVTIFYRIIIRSYLTPFGINAVALIIMP